MSNLTTEHSHRSEGIVLNAVSSAVMFFILTAVLLFTLLFTTYPPIHDYFHGLRHAIMIVPCH